MFILKRYSTSLSISFVNQSCLWKLGMFLDQVLIWNTYCITLSLILMVLLLLVTLQESQHIWSSYNNTTINLEFQHACFLKNRNILAIWLCQGAYYWGTVIRFPILPSTWGSKLKMSTTYVLYTCRNLGWCSNKTKKLASFWHNSDAFQYIYMTFNTLKGFISPWSWS